MEEEWTELFSLLFIVNKVHFQEFRYEPEPEGEKNGEIAECKKNDKNYKEKRGKDWKRGKREGGKTER